jgi:hypothetical protein
VVFSCRCPGVDADREVVDGMLDELKIMVQGEKGCYKINMLFYCHEIKVAALEVVEEAME